MKKFSLLIALCLSAFVFVTQAEAYRINVAGWRGNSYNSKTTGRFNHCVVSAKYKRGDRLLFVINRKYVFSISIADNRWNYRKGDTFPVTLQVDNRQQFERTAKVVARDQIVIQINDRIAFFKMIRSGRTLHVSSDDFNRGYNLRGTSRALKATLRCVKVKLKNDRYAGRDVEEPPRNTTPGNTTPGNNDDTRNNGDSREVNVPAGNGRPRAGSDIIVRNSRVPSNPRKPSNTSGPAQNGFSNDDTPEQPRKMVSAPPQTPPKSLSQGVSEQKALIKAINLLSEAGISGYKILEKNPFKKYGYQVAWSYSKTTRGALAIFPDQGKTFINTKTAAILGSDAKACRGKFASGFRISDSTKKWSGRRLFTVCSASSDGNDFTIHYSLGLQPSGTATIVATQVNSDGMLNPQTDDSEKIDQAIYESNTFRTIGK